MQDLQVLFVKIPFFQKVGNGLRLKHFKWLFLMLKCWLLYGFSLFIKIHAVFNVEMLASVWIFIVHQNSLLIVY
jgi:hypothetical protein